MSLTSRILLGFALMSCAGFYFLLNPVLDRVERQYLEAAEEPMVDAAEILAAIVSRQLAGGAPAVDPAISGGMAATRERLLNARIYNLLKQKVSMDLYVTDAKGTVLYDSGNPASVGEDFTRFPDVYHTLRGHYGARSTRGDESDPTSSVMYVAAPILIDGAIAGVLTVYKPQRSMLTFIQETRRQLKLLAAVATAAFLLVGLVLSRWVTEPLRRLTAHAAAITRGDRPAPPKMPGSHLRVLGETLERMRDALENRKYVESYVQTLTHEMKGPVSAIRGAAELLDEDLPPGRRRQFANNIQSESIRLERLTDQLLALASLESRKGLESPQELDVAALARRLADNARFRIAPAGLNLAVESAGACTVRGEEFLLESAISNLIQNAIDFSPPGGSIAIDVRSGLDRKVVVTVEDEGPGVPDYAIDRVFDRFYSLPRPGSGRKSSGLGLCFVRETAALHGGTAAIENRTDRPGARATLTLPQS